MKWVSSADQVRELDRATIEDVGVPGVALMELASHGVARAVREHHEADARKGIVVVCGGGNNGGDGYAAARWLHGWGFDVRIWSLKLDSSGDAETMRDACFRMGIRETDELGRCGLIIDAVFGTGLSRAVKGPALEALQAIAQHPAPVIAVDLPSGVDADTGQTLGVAVQAARTVTFGRLKPGLLQAPGAALAGEVEVVDIGLDAALGDDPMAIAEVPEARDLAPLVPTRNRHAHKKSSGHLLVIAGSTPMAGAAVLACRAALRGGAGLVTLYTPAGALRRLGNLPPEVMVLSSPAVDVFEDAPELDLAPYDALVAGPGLGGGRPIAEGFGTFLKHLWTLDDRPILFDADALPLATGKGGGPRVITPHPGEAGRLLNRTSAAIQGNRRARAEELALGRVCLLKGANTIVAGPGRTSFNPTGGPVLATAGSGDVLAGLIGALLARGMSARDAARVGAWVHGAAGDRLAAIRSEGWTAGDIAEAIPHAIEDLRGAG